MTRPFSIYFWFVKRPINDELLDSVDPDATVHVYTPLDVEHSVQLSASMKRYEMSVIGYA